MNRLLRTLALAVVVGAAVAVSQPTEARAQYPYGVTYTYRVPVTYTYSAPATYYYSSPPVYQVAPTVAYRPVVVAPTTVYSPPVSVGYAAPTVVQYRGLFGVPRRTVYYGGGYVVPAPIVYPSW